MAALSARWENADAIDTALTSAVEDPDSRHQYKINRLIPFSPVDKRTTAYCTGPDGKDFVTTKGAPQVRLLCLPLPHFLVVSFSTWWPACDDPFFTGPYEDVTCLHKQAAFNMDLLRNYLPLF